MKPIAIILIIFWTIIIIMPEIIAYLLWWALIFIWLNMLFIWLALKKKAGFAKEDYVKFGKYKIFR